MGRRIFGLSPEGRGESGEEHRVRGVIDAARIKDRYEGRPVEPDMTPE